MKYGAWEVDPDYDVLGRGDWALVVSRVFRLSYTKHACVLGWMRGGVGD